MTSSAERYKFLPLTATRRKELNISYVGSEKAESIR